MEGLRAGIFFWFLHVAAGIQV